jgi:hypothetical protein
MLLLVIYSDGCGVATAATPVPVKLTCCIPDVASSLLIIQVSETAPVVVGLKVTVSVTDFPGGIVVPSASVVMALKPTLAAGGLDLVMVRFTPPVLATEKEVTAVPPTETLPKSVLIGVICSFCGCPPLPDKGTSAGPADVFSTRSSVNEPTVVGANVTVAVTLESAAMVEPLAGRPVTENGAAGSVALLTVSGWAPPLVNVTVCEAEPPLIATPPKLIVVGDALTVALEDSALPETLKLDVPIDVVAVRVPEYNPG